MNPRQQEWQRIGANLLDSMHALCWVDIRTPQVQPFTQGPAVIGGLARFTVCDDKAGDRYAGDEKEEQEGLAFRHVARMPSGAVAVNPNSDALWK